MFSLIYIRDLIVFTLFFIYRRIYPPPSASQVIVPTRTLLSNSGVNCRRAIPLPQETLEHIFFLHIASLVDSLQCETVQDYRVRKSHLLSEIAAVARCSKRFHAIMRGCLSRIWASCGLGLGLCSQKVGPGTADRPARYIWIITAEQGCLPLNVDLAVHIMLKIASINYHDGVQWSKNQQGFRRLRCVRAYPRSLRQLEILRSHTPEEEVINLVSDCCPGLTELRLGRCTMFNDPKCWYWRTHTRNQDHDYMKTWDPAAVVDYANDMALLLCRLPQLEAIHIGHYLIDINAVLTHRLDPAHGRHHPIVDRRNHIDGAMTMSILQFMANADEGPPINPNGLRLADKELWITPCPQCETEFKQLIEDAERRAAGIMAAHFQHLKHVSFANFLSGGRVTPSSWLVGRQERGPDLYVRTEDPSRPRRSRMMQPMVHVGNRWEPLPTA